MKDFVDIFLGSSHNWTIFRGHFYGFYGLFLNSRYRMGDIFGVAKISNIVLGCLKFLISWVGGGGLNGRCWAPSLRMKKKREHPPPTWGQWHKKSRPIQSYHFRF